MAKEVNWDRIREYCGELYRRDRQKKLSEMFRMRRMRRFGAPERGTRTGYQLPRIVRRALQTRLQPLLLSGRPKTIMAAEDLMTLIGRFHTHPDHFDRRACGLGEDGGFHLDRRGLSNENTRPKGCDRLTEWSVREATGFLLKMGIIERITPKAMVASEDRLGRSGFWIPAKKDRFGQIRAPGIRYKLSTLYRSLFSKANGTYPQDGYVSGKSPVKGRTKLSRIRDMDIGKVGVSTGGPRSEAEVSALVADIIAEREAAKTPERRAALAADLEKRRLAREARGGW